jgi:sugar transporter family protein
VVQDRFCALRVFSGKNDDAAGEINEMLEVQRAEANQENVGGAGTYGIFAAINFLSFLFYWKFVPETKFHSLEELELKFQKDYS